MATPDYIRRIRDVIGHELILAPSVTAFIVSDKNEILVVKSREDLAWTLPGGIVEPGESPADTLIRETEEETGYCVRPVSVLAVLGGPNGFRRKYANGDLVEFVDILFVSKILRQEAQALDQEVVECKFTSAALLDNWRYPVPASYLLQVVKTGGTILGSQSGLSVLPIAPI